MRRDELERKEQTGRKTYVTGMVGNNNTVIATVLPPPSSVQHSHGDVDPPQRHGV